MIRVMSGQKTARQQENKTKRQPDPNKSFIVMFGQFGILEMFVAWLEDKLN